MSFRHFILNSVVCILFLPVLVSAQLREFDITPSSADGPIPVFRDYPDKVAVIIRSSLTNLTFDSNLSITANRSESVRGEYVLILDPVRQSLTINAPGYQQGRIQITLTDARQVAYYKVEPKPEVATNLIPTNFLITPNEVSVYISGSLVDITKPVLIEAGTHILRVEKMGYYPLEKAIQVSLGQNLFREELELIVAVPVAIQTQPAGATVLIEGRRVGVSDKSGSLNFSQIPGSYKMDVTYEGYVSDSRQIAISRTSGNFFNSNLVRNIGTLRIQIYPSDAIVKLNQSEQRKIDELELLPGQYLLEVSKQGYDTFTELLDLRLGVDLTRTIKLERNTGALILDVDPRDAKVTIGSLMVNAHDTIYLPPGVHKIDVSKPKYDSISDSIVIFRQKSEQRDIALVPRLGSLKVDIWPENATWNLSESSLGWVAGGRGSMNIEKVFEGNYTMTIRSDGYEPQALDFSVLIGATTERRVRLGTIQYGLLTINTNVSGATGRLMQNKKLVEFLRQSENGSHGQYQLPVGRYVLELNEHEYYSAQRVRIKIKDEYESIYLKRRGMYWRGFLELVSIDIQSYFEPKATLSFSVLSFGFSDPSGWSVGGMAIRTTYLGEPDSSKTYWYDEILGLSLQKWVKKPAPGFSEYEFTWGIRATLNSPMMSYFDVSKTNSEGEGYSKIGSNYFIFNELDANIRLDLVAVRFLGISLTGGYRLRRVDTFRGYNLPTGAYTSVQFNWVYWRAWNDTSDE